MLTLSFIAMYLLMYAMVDRLVNVYNSLNQAYMAGLMTAPMAIFEVLLMGMMYPNKRRNGWIVVGGLTLLVGCFWAIREQAAIGDRQFLRSMIPHHAGAILMCEEADLQDPEITKLCEDIRSSQQTEIDIMKRKLSELDD